MMPVRLVELSLADLPASRSFSSEGLSNEVMPGREVDRVILRELLLSWLSLSTRAYFGARRSGCGTVKDVLRLIAAPDSSSSDSLSSASYRPGYCRRRSC